MCAIVIGISSTIAERYHRIPMWHFGHVGGSTCAKESRSRSILPLRMSGPAEERPSLKDRKIVLAAICIPWGRHAFSRSLRVARPS